MNGPSRKSDRSPSRLALAASVLVLALIAVAAQRRALGYGFVGGDTLTLIETSRIASWADLRRVLSQPLMAGSGFLESGSFYRPLVGLSFALDWAVSGLHPFGYQLTGVLLHALATVAVFRLALEWSRGVAVAWIAATFFAMHPLAVETVPIPSNRQDVLVTALSSFALASLLRSARHDRRSARCAIAAALFAFGAMLTKETALVLVPVAVVLAWVAVDDPDRGPQRGRRALVLAAPILGACAIGLALHTAVVGGLGGYAPASRGWGDLVETVRNVAYSALDLLYPAWLIENLRPSLGLGIAVAAVALASAAWLWRSSYATSAAVAPRGLAFLVAAGGVAYPWLASRIWSGAASEGAGVRLPAASAAEIYAGRIHAVVLCAILGACVVALALAKAPRSAVAAEPTSPRLPEGALWFAVLAPIGLSVAARSFSHRLMYLPLAPFAILVGMAVIAVAGARGGPVSTAVRVLRPVVVIAAIGSVLLSPMFGGYRAWQDVSGLQARLTGACLGTFDREHPDGEVLLRGLPIKITTHDSGIRRVRDVSHLSAYDFTSWIRLHRSGSTVSFRSESYAILPRVPDVVRVAPIPVDGPVWAFQFEPEAALVPVGDRARR